MSPSKSLRTRHIHIKSRYWTTYRLFKIISAWELSIGMEFQSKVICKSIASRNIQPDMNYIFLNLIFLNCKEQLGIQRMSLSKVRANEADSTPNTNNTF